MAVGDRLFELRKAAGLSQEMLAEKLSVSRQTISKWESGVSTPDINNILAICSLFNVSTDYLLLDNLSVKDKNVQIEDAGAETPTSIIVEDSVAEKQPPINKKAKKKRHFGVWIVLLIVMLSIAATVFYFLVGKPERKTTKIPVPDITESETNDTSSSENIDISELAKSVLYLELYDNADNIIGSASAVPIDNNTVVTNYHVIDGTYAIIAYNSEGTVESKISTVLAYSEKEDLAILRCEQAVNVAPLTIGNSNEVKQGDKVFAVGYPLGLSNTLSDGIVSSLYKDENYVDLIQITAPISPGSSGGALFNENGDVVGIVCASYENGQNMNLAIPSKYITKMRSAVNGSISIEQFYQNNFPNGLLTMSNDTGKELELTVGNLQGIWKHIFDSGSGERILITTVIDENSAIQLWEYADGSYMK